jgi:hypothetical protein
MRFADYFSRDKISKEKVQEGKEKRFTLGEQML